RGPLPVRRRCSPESVGAGAGVGVGGGVGAGEGCGVGVGVTFSVVAPETPPRVALIVDVPGATPVAIPVVATVATDVVAGVHVTWPVRSSVVSSENVPVAVNASIPPLMMLVLAGVTTIDCNAAGPTVSAVWPVTPPRVAVIVDVPCPTPVASPAALMVATGV